MDISIWRKVKLKDRAGRGWYPYECLLSVEEHIHIFMISVSENYSLESEWCFTRSTLSLPKTRSLFYETRFKQFF